VRKIGGDLGIVCLLIVFVIVITFSISSFNIRNLVDALFLEGAALLSIGGILAAGLPKISLLKFTTEKAAQSQESKEAREEEGRRRNSRIGFTLMLAGLVLIGLCIGVGELILH